MIHLNWCYTKLYQYVYKIEQILLQSLNIMFTNCTAKGNKYHIYYYINNM